MYNTIQFGEALLGYGGLATGLVFDTPKVGSKTLTASKVTQK